MATEKLYAFNEQFEKYIASEMQYKCCRLLNKEGVSLVGYNNTKSKILIREKLKEIGRKIKSLPDGLYTLQCQHTMNTAGTPDNFFIRKGRATLGDGEEMIIPIRNQIENKENKLDTKADILSTQSALTRIEEIATLRAENMVYKNRIVDLEKAVAELEAELDEAETLNENGDGSIASLLTKENSPLKGIADLIPSLADSFFNYKNRELALKEKELEKKNGAHKTNFAQRRFKVKRKENEGEGNQLDLSDNSKVEKYFSIMENLEDADFNNEVARAKEQQPALFEAIREEFSLDENGDAIEEEEN
jgi:hypothetical protein